MGLIRDALRGIAKPIVEEIVGAQNVAKADAPQAKSINMFDVPANAMLGYPFSGTSKRKLGSSVDFETLRTFSVIYDVARACINHRKTQISNLDWAIVPKDQKRKVQQAQVDAVTKFFKRPAHAVDFKTFADRILEDLLVFDAVVLWKGKTRGGELMEVVNVDGSTIRMKIQEDGTLPEPPEKAYQQIIAGQVRSEWTTDQLIYKIMNPRTNTPYGLSPLESLIIGVDAALRSQMYNSSLLSEGTVPEGFFGVPPEWTPEQIKDYQMWFDTTLAGNFRNNSRIKFMPGGKGVGYMPTKKVEDMKFLELEKWLLMKTCALFSVQPRDIGFEDNAQPGNAETQQDLGNQRGLVPTARFLKTLFTEIMENDMGIDDLVFEWKGMQAVDDDFELKRNDTMIGRGAKTINEWRTEQGQEPYADPIADEPIIFTSTGPVLLSDVKPRDQQPVDPNIAQNNTMSQDGKVIEEMDKWESKCVSSLKKGRGIPDFNCEYIDKSAQAIIRTRLLVAKTREDVKAAFRPIRSILVERALVSRASKLGDDIAAHRRETYGQAR